MEMLIGLAAGIIIGCACSAVIRRFKSSGTLYVDKSEDGEPYLFLELGENIGDISKKKRVTFKVRFKNFLPRK